MCRRKVPAYAVALKDSLTATRVDLRVEGSDAQCILVISRARLDTMCEASADWEADSG